MTDKLTPETLRLVADSIYELIGAVGPRVKVVNDHADAWEAERAALLRVKNLITKFGEYDTLNLLAVIADDYEKQGDPPIVVNARVRRLRDWIAALEKDFGDD